MEKNDNTEEEFSEEFLGKISEPEMKRNIRKMIILGFISGISALATVAGAIMAKLSDDLFLPGFITVLVSAAILALSYIPLRNIKDNMKREGLMDDDDNFGDYIHATEGENEQEEFDEMPPLSPEIIEELYGELGVSPDCSDAEVRSAYHEMAKRYHPDLYHNTTSQEKAELSAKFQNIREAYELIKHLRDMK